MNYPVWTAYNSGMLQCNFNILQTVTGFPYYILKIRRSLGLVEAGAGPMVKRIKEEGMAGALEFEGMGKDDPRLQEWLDEHRARNGGKVRVGLGGKGVRVMFARDADLQYWRSHYQRVRAAA
jgi:hypothetical protein